ncbi:hypothetical protein [Stutzerimonas stutzeri]|uniref:hypothetical protein n=1 Tax=Stutzerimonas stutzeri TaxID=316 RepID=UPI0002602852|nr:hypothetical protein [Stutzerimonas stutzeri]EIK53233.1 hypothetical protein YO5_09190 [Stutzerimonas stutzeri TS44]
MSKATTYYIAELVGAVEGHALFGVATLLAEALSFPLERIGHMPLEGGRTGVLVLWEIATCEAGAKLKADTVRKQLASRGGPMLEGIGPSQLHLYVTDEWQPIASSLGGGIQ